MGGDVRCGALEWKQWTMAPASLLFFFFSAATAAPSRCGDHPTKSLRRIIQTQIKKNRATFRVMGGGGGGKGIVGEVGGTLRLCAVGTRCVYTTQQLVAGLLWTHTADDRDNRETGGAASLDLLS